MKNMKRAIVDVKLKATPDDGYPIVIDDSVGFLLNDVVKDVTKARKFLVVTDKNVFELYGDKLKLDNAEFVALDFNEQTKTLASYAFILDKAQQMKLERKDAIVALGGGIVGDVAGFCAATYLRGIDFIQVPTTLLAQVDSSVGGKVGVNTNFGKNLIGAFYQPKLVYANLEVLDTLDERQFETGLSEVVKYAFIEGAIEPQCRGTFFDYLNSNVDAILAKDKQTLRYVVQRCCELKSQVVFQDEKEAGLRAVLNYGHTFAHAIEKVTGYDTFTHGEALATGMKMALMLSLRLGLIELSYFDQAIGLIDVFGLGVELPRGLCVKDLVYTMALDKKVDAGRLRFVLSDGDSTVVIKDDVPINLVEDVIGGFCAAG